MASQHLPKGVGEGIIIAYEHNSHPSKIKLDPLYIGGWFISNDLDYTRKFRVLKANSIVKPTKLSKTWVAYYIMVFMLGEREVHSYAIISSLMRGMQIEGGEG